MFKLKRIMFAFFVLTWVGCGGGDENNSEDTGGSTPDTAVTGDIEAAKDTPAPEDTPAPQDTSSNADTSADLPQEPDTGPIPVPESFPELNTCDAKMYWCIESYCGDDAWVSDWTTDVANYHAAYYLPEWQPQKGNFCGEIPGRFEDVDSGYDTKYDHMLKGHWSEKNNFFDDGMKWAKADCYCQDMGDDYRLPTILELISIFGSELGNSDNGGGCPSVHYGYCAFWSSTKTWNTLGQNPHWGASPAFQLAGAPGTGGLWEASSSFPDPDNPGNAYKLRRAICFRPDVPDTDPSEVQCVCKPKDECVACVGEKYPEVWPNLEVALQDHCICSSECQEHCGDVCANPSLDGSEECADCFGDLLGTPGNACSQGFGSACQNMPNCGAYLQEIANCGGLL